MRLVRTEWIKFRTVRGWTAGLVVAGLMVVLVALLAGVSSDQRGAPPVPVGPGGEPVTDSFSFVRRSLTGDGSISVSVAGLTTGVPWAKAGLIVKQSTRPGSPYAAIMVTGSHGVRMQHNYVNDTAGPVPAGPVRRLRLDRSGDTVTGYASADGTHWTEVGAVELELGPAAQGGLFVASPPVVEGLGTIGTVSTATFTDLRTSGSWSGDAWAGEQVGARSATFAGYPQDTSASFEETGGGFTVTGAGDIAPAVRETLPTGGTVKDLLTGTFAALIAVSVVAALSVTTEYRTSLMHVTLAAAPRRGRVLLAKAVVLGGVTFATGLVGAVAAVPLGERLARSNGVYLFPVTDSTGLRVALGTAVLLAAASVLALSAGVIFRRSAVAVTTVLVALVLPYLLVANPFMPVGAANWLTRVTPAAAFAVQQTLVEYPQVSSIYKPYNGYWPLGPWAGLAVLVAYAVAGLGVAAVVLTRRDA
ncbi:hypothetical protein [Actinoplanes friuliensis]|uniref:Uncharacterized protein n=1 Tax=Actinoplanes friuliensis DSM 7358 TaxID=1246995 RepID=U5VWP3_9ACTN|nr:hypothetical protein [Actinoplanes friuliensis]AGZ41294.1 hypothetical protein AFR_15060 [Actinoplanes friuliensis DSM 7358]